jgi:chemotaxis protein methyltransferase CheR
LKLEISNSEKLLATLQEDQISFNKLAQILKNKTGINLALNDKNLTLMASRLIKILKKREITKYKDYIDILNQNNSSELSEFISAMTTNTTQFFREVDHFTIMEKWLTHLIEEKKNQHNYELRVWCSASSTGQEVYTILMVLLNKIPNLQSWDIKFLATDIDLKVLQKAADGVYNESEILGISEINMKKYFHVIKTEDRPLYQINSTFRDLIRFAPFNLLTEKYPFQFPFDIIFCRNVLIYFDRPTAENVINKLGQTLGKNGLLFLGHSETGMMKSKLLKPIANSVYQRA